MLYSSLDIKQIQNDTLSHFLLSRISTLYPDQHVLYNMALARYIYSSNEDETPPQIWAAFREGTYHNVPDFWNLWMKLRHSLTRAVLYREREFVAMSNKTEREPLDEIDEELWDQRDLTVMTDCELPGHPSLEEFTRIGPLERVQSFGTLI
jgi:N-terminal acetyltransferase B complex non-catalytic subunit